VGLVFNYRTMQGKHEKWHGENVKLDKVAAAKAQMCKKTK